MDRYFPRLIEGLEGSRGSLGPVHAGMQKSETGEYVLLKDVHALMNRLALLVSQLVNTPVQYEPVPGMAHYVRDDWGSLLLVPEVRPSESCVVIQKVYQELTNIIREVNQ